MQIFNDQGYLKWSASQHRQVKSICGWRWVLQKLEDKEGESTMSRATGSTGHKINELALQIQHQTGNLPDHETVNKWVDEWFYYYIERDGKRMLSFEKKYYNSDSDCIEDYATIARQLARKCVDKCTPEIDIEISEEGKLQIEVPWDFKIEEFKIIMRGRIDIIEKGNIVSDLKFKGCRPLCDMTGKKGDYGAKCVSSIDNDEQGIIYSAAIHTTTGEYPAIKFHNILHQSKQDIYQPITTKHNNKYMQILFNNLKGVRPLIEATIKNPDTMISASEYGYFCSEDMCDFWDQCDKHY